MLRFDTKKVVRSGLHPDIIDIPIGSITSKNENILKNSDNAQNNSK